MRWISPVPCINGSKASDLAEQMLEVHRTLEAAAETMRKWQPHGRDYQVGGDYMTDRREFERRHQLVCEMAHQYWEEAERMMDYHYRRPVEEVNQ